MLKILPLQEGVPDWNTLTPESIQATTSRMIAEGKKNMQSICAIAPADRTFENTILPYDRLFDRYEVLHGVIDLMAYVHPDETIREACWKSIADIDQFSHEISLDEPLFQAVKAFCDLPAYQKLQGPRKKYAQDLMLEYRRHGFLLGSTERETLKGMLDRLTEIDIAFTSNINEYQDQLVLSEEEMTGLPEDYKQKRKTEDGRFAITLDEPSYRPFMKYAESGSARRALYYKYNTRVPQNNGVLLDLLKERQAWASLLHYPTYAAYATEVAMAQNPEAILQFEKDLQKRTRVKAQHDVDELLSIKGDSSGTLYPWEISYYTTKLLKTKYGVDSERLKHYFVMENVIQGIFDILGKLYQVEFEEDRHAKTWHPDVKTFIMKHQGQPAGLIWLDLYPRTGKYNHMACFTICNGHQTEQGNRLPVAALVCNFPAPTSTTPSLLLHTDVVTLFHECGHLIHSLLSQGELSSQTGITNEQDFVEVPSQLFENWAWSYEVLQRFARHDQTGEILPKTLFDKLWAARQVCSGTQTLQQIFYGMIDLTYHNGLEAPDEQTLNDIVQRLQNDITLYPFMEGTHFQTSFGHLTNYGAGYYGYLWALVYAQDLFSVFEKEGLLNEATGNRFKEQVLQKGSSEEAYRLVSDFLQREPSQVPFLNMIGL